MVGTLLPSRNAVNMALVTAGTAYGASFAVNRLGSQLAAIPGFKFLSEIEKQGVVEASVGVGLLSLLSMMVAKWVGM